MKTILILLAFATSASGAIHLSRRGDDGAGDGSAAKPFATVARALQAEGETLDIVLAAGRYAIAEPIRISRPGVTLRAENPGEVWITGGVQPKGGGVEDGGKAISWAAPEGLTPREFFINNSRAPRARHPNEGFMRIEKTGPDRRTSFFVAGKDVAAAKKAVGAELVFMHDWSTTRVTVKAFDAATRELTVSSPIGNSKAAHYAIDHFEKQPRYFFEGTKALLDQRGEWCFDRATKKLLHIPAFKNMVAFVPRSRGLLVADGADGLKVEGITFEYSAWNLPAGGYAGSQAAFHEDRPEIGKFAGRVPVPAAVLIERSKGVQFVGCTFRHLGGSGLWFRQACNDCSAERCVFEDISANGVMIGEANGASQPDRAETSTRVALRDCEVKYCGVQLPGSVGIWVGMANHVKLTGSHLHDLPYTGISVGWMWNPQPTGCHHNLIAGNHIHDIMRVLSDGGGVYTLGRQPGTVIRGNTIHDIMPNAGRAESNGMFLDEGSTGLLIEGNTIYRVARSPLRFHKAGVNLVRGNRLFLPAEGVPVVRYNNTPEANVKLEDNGVKVGAPDGE